MRKHISPATIIASAALFFSFTGAGMAAGHYLITSRSQIAPSVRVALHGQPGPAGAPGPQGVQGIQGPVGASGTVNFSQIVRVTTSTALSSSTPTGTAIGNCPSGDDVLTGGYIGTNELVTASFAKDPNEWVVAASLQPNASSGLVEAWVECVPVS